MTRETIIRTPSVLIVDDQPSVARPIAQLLRRRGFDAVIAETGSAVLVVSKPFEIAELERAIRSVILDKLEPPA